MDSSSELAFTSSALCDLPQFLSPTTPPPPLPLTTLLLPSMVSSPVLATEDNPTDPLINYLNYDLQNSMLEDTLPHFDASLELQSCEPNKALFGPVKDFSNPISHSQNIILNSQIFNNFKHRQIEKPYKCTICPESYNLERNLLLHRAGHLIAPATCPECKITFQRTSSFRGHLATHIVSDNLKCTKCSEEFNVEKSFKQHLENAHKNDANTNNQIRRKNYFCKICSKGFLKKNSLSRHEITHLSEKPFNCLECERSFTQKTSLETHKLIHGGIKPYACKECPIKFTQKSNFLTHKTRVHPSIHEPISPEKHFPCPQCGSVFKKQNNLGSHITKVHKKNDKIAPKLDENVSEVMEQIKRLQEEIVEENLLLLPKEKFLAESNGSSSYINSLNKQNAKLVRQIDSEGVLWWLCQICDRRFRKSSDLIRHLRIHKREKPFECADCNKFFALKSTLKNHQNTHQCGKMLYECFTCHKMFRYTKALNEHMKNVHCNTKHLMCEICGQKFSTLRYLRCHFRRRHIHDYMKETLKIETKEPILLQKTISHDQQERPYECLKCDKRFKQLSYLKIHDLIHLNSTMKKFSCETCSRSFTSNRALSWHMKKKHSNELEFKLCDVCEAKFPSNYELKRHQITHSNHRNFICPYCKNAFKRKTDCAEHIARHVINGMTISPLIVEDNLTGCEETEPFASDTPSAQLFSDVENSLEIQNLTELQENSGSVMITVNAAEKQYSAKGLEERTQTSNNQSKDDCIKKFYQCEECMKTFNRINALNRHRAIHSQIRNFQCEICSKAFLLKGQLKKHLTTHEVNRLKFECQVCAKVFTSADNLKIHLRLHTGERPEKCPWCEKTFRTIGHKTAHLKVHDKRNINNA